MDFLSDDDILNRDSSDDELSLTPARRGIVRPLPPSAERMNRQQLNRFQGMSWYDNHDGTIEIRSNTGGVVTTWTSYLEDRTWWGYYYIYESSEPHKKTCFTNDYHQQQ